jgi:hypothetical protein
MKEDKRQVVRLPIPCKSYLQGVAGELPWEMEVETYINSRLHHN